MSVDFKEYGRKMEKTLDVLAENFGAVRAGRANAKVLDRISVEYYGSETPLAGVATILVPPINNHNFWLKARHVLEKPFIFIARNRRINK